MIYKMPKQSFEQTCKMRGYTFEECKNSIVKEEPNSVFKDKDGKEFRVDAYYVDDEHETFPHSVGVGAELKKLFSMIGIKATPNCSCNRRAANMDQKGIAWCKENKEEILSWLAEEAKKRKIPFVKFAAESALKIAIKRAEKNPRSKP
jgi:hypothetical protein